MKPCDEIPGLRCCHAGFCWGRHYFGKKVEKTPLGQVETCLWQHTVLERHRRDGGEIPAGLMPAQR